MPIAFVTAFLWLQTQHASARSGGQMAALLGEIAASGRCVTLAVTPDDRVRGRLHLAPGQPPLLSFRIYEGRGHRNNDAGLMLDDAGH